MSEEEKIDETEAATEAEAEPEEDEVSLDEFVRLNERRANTYGLLSRLLLKEVDEPLLRQLRGMRFPAATGNKALDKGQHLMVGYLSNVWENSLTELSLDFTRTFMGSGMTGFSAAYPFESVYTSEKRLLMQDARGEVLAIYRSNGLNKKDSWKEGEDHVSAELEFEQIMAERTAEALKHGKEELAAKYLKTSLNFLEDHLLAWVPMMTADIRKMCKTDFYKGLSYMVNGFLAVDRDLLQDVLTPPEDEEDEDAQDADEGEEAQEETRDETEAEESQEEAQDD